MDADRVINFDSFQTPAYVCDEAALENNLNVYRHIQDATGCEVILALKAFSMYHMFPLIRRYLKGTAASSLYEARLGYETFNEHVHIYCPAYREHEIEDITHYCNTITFNSMSQLHQFSPLILQKKPDAHIGLRINPEISVVENALYNPCQPFSRFGVPISQIDKFPSDAVHGLHVHALCGNGAAELDTIVQKVEAQCGDWLHAMDWINLGGGHLITSQNYDIDQLLTIIDRLQSSYSCKVILEPGESVVYRAAYLVATVLDIVDNGMKIAILDTSATAHMPDVIEMPYRPNIVDSFLPNEAPFTYKIGGVSCLSGDVIGDYSFNTPLTVGSRLIFEDMAQYTMVKNTHFNGIPLPDIYVARQAGELENVKSFSYTNFKNRL